MPRSARLSRPSSFRRSFVLLLVLVALPSAGLAAFGVLAIVNERAAVEKRLRAQWEGRLERLGSRLMERLGSSGLVDRADGLALVDGEGRTLSRLRFSLSPGGLVLPEPAGAAGTPEEGSGHPSWERVRERLEELRPRLLEAPTETLITLIGAEGPLILMMRPVGGNPAAPVGSGRGPELERDVRSGPAFTQSAPGDPEEARPMTRRGVVLTTAQLDALLEELSRELTLGESVRFILLPFQADSAGMVGRLVQGVMSSSDGAELADRRLPPPLDELRLVALPQGEDPVDRTSTRNRALYGVLLGALFVTLGIGIAYTAVALHREVRLSRMKTDFVSLVSHELRTPLTSIRMFIETLALGRVRDPIQEREILTMLTKETERLSDLIERVLDWSRLDSGKRSVERAPVPPEAILAEALESFRAQRLAEGVALTVEIEPELPELLADRVALSGVLLNLLQNAHKYSGEEKRIRASLRREGSELVFEVEDNGIGIARADRKRIFEQFFRVDNLMTRRTEGSGLGLAIARRVVEAHGGKLTLDSNPGQGSRFAVRLPLQRDSSGPRRVA